MGLVKSILSMEARARMTMNDSATLPKLAARIIAKLYNRGLSRALFSIDLMEAANAFGYSSYCELQRRIGLPKCSR
jgi:hypothetical protein